MPTQANTNETLLSALQAANSNDRRPALLALGILSEEDVGRILDVKQNTLFYWRRQGRGPAFVQLGRTIYYRVSDIKAWIEGNVRVLADAQSEALQQDEVTAA